LTKAQVARNGGLLQSIPATGRAVLIVTLLAACFPSRAAEFAGVFGDRMVLQRDRPIAVWGTAAPREEVTVTIADSSRSVETDASGRWELVLPAMPAGGPHELTLHADGQARSLEDVLVGDLWLCSGQSNMAYPYASSSGHYGQPVNAHERIRLFTVPRDSHPQPRMEFRQAPEWLVADADSIPAFSAVCFFFAQELQKTHDVPLGLIHASWGGSAIQPWMSTAALEKAGGFDAPLDLLERYTADVDDATARFGAEWENWWRGAVSTSELPWNPENSSSWKPVPAMQDWKTFGDEELTDHNGMLWFAKSFELTADEARQAASLSLGGIDEVDVTWINGRFVGTEFGWGTERTYEVPDGVLRPGPNVVVLNVLSTWGSGGMLGPKEDVRLSFTDGDARSLGEGWQYRRVPSEFGLPPRAPWESIGGLAGLFNAMVAPLQGLNLRGALWYQGESNADDASPYGGLLSEIIADWRRRFGGSLAFLIVQLPNFGELPEAPTESGWAALRDAQRRVALDDPRTGLVVTVDVGDRLDLHPPNKLIVGQRAADVARALVFDEGGLVDGISPLRAARRANEVIVELAPAEETLVVIGDDRPLAFELCTDEPSRCEYANARLERNRIYIDAADVRNATRVRHCWADAPVCNLYGASGLPVGTFEIAITASGDAL
jgi:sialate O-acetylesterase